MSIINTGGCYAYCIAEEFRWESLISSFEHDEEYTIDVKDEFIWLRINNIENSEVAIFKYGCLVFWQLSKENSMAFLNGINRYAKDLYPSSEFEEFRVVVADKTKVKGNIINLVKDGLLDKESISYALSQAVKLSQYENIVEKTMQELQHIPEKLAKYGKVSMSRKQAMKKTGKIFIVRSKINLHSDLLDTPDYFWDKGMQEELYMTVIAEMDLSKRLSNLNKRLDIMQELYDILSEQIRHFHSVVLEVVIILLISIEVVMGLMTLYYG